ncbi:MAG: hypothetical protein A2987_02295 [Omnitrophica bacterium RIFCSPLOWO2_01_FULL_45_10]|nr:MAG: hypothetical protein A2987_02295 [Omnitrophica bacterium RIFCSPLOWO2_01_FULL_45_10]
MREVQFKELCSRNTRKKDIFLKDVFEKDGIMTKTERRCLYFLKEAIHLEKPEDLQKWLDSQSPSKNPAKRNFHILKEHNDSIGEDKIICKIAGTFYAVVTKTIYVIYFLHYFKTQFIKLSIAK